MLRRLTHKERIRSRKSELRINSSNKQSGYATSYTVSPFQVDINEWCEPGILPVVSPLLGKNYMTISSCESHSFSDSAFVYIAFGREDQAEHFCKTLKPLGDIGVSTTVMKASDYMEQYEDYTEDLKDVAEERKRQVFRRKKMSKDQAANCINKLYRRGYEEYWLVRLVVVAGLDDTNEITAIANYYFRKKDKIKKTADFIKKELGLYEG
jgi:hypothetical protein